MKCFVSLVVTSVSLAALAAREKPVVFVDNFVPNEKCVISEGQQQTLRDRIIGNVTASGRYDVVDRRNLERVQKEIEIAAAGLVEGNAPEENRLKAAGYCIYGKVLQYRSHVQDLDVQKKCSGIVEVQLRIEDIQSGQILGAPTVRIEEPGRILIGQQSTQNLEETTLAAALDRCAKEVVFRLNEMAFPVYVDDADGKYVTGNVSAEQVSKGEIWEVWEVGKKIMDRDTGKWTGRYREKSLCKVTVALPGAKATKFACSSPEDGKMLEEKLNQNIPMILRRTDEKPLAETRQPTAVRRQLDKIR